MFAWIMVYLCPLVVWVYGVTRAGEIKCISCMNSPIYFSRRTVTGDSGLCHVMIQFLGNASQVMWWVGGGLYSRNNYIVHGMGIPGEIIRVVLAVFLARHIICDYLRCGRSDHCTLDQIAYFFALDRLASPHLALSGSGVLAHFPWRKESKE